MTAKAKTGLLAVAIVLGMALCAGGGIVGLVLNKKGSSQLKVIQNEYTDEEIVLNHRWWKKPPTGLTLDAIIKTAIDSKSGSCIWIDNEGQWVQTREKKTVNGIVDVFVEPKQFAGRRYIQLPLDGNFRPSRDSILSAIKIKMDKDSYKN